VIYLWLLSLLIEAAIFIAIEHNDRKKVHKILRFVSGDRPEVVKEVMAVKSWWERIKKGLTKLFCLMMVIFVLWLTIQLRSN
jgi:hypothetical protein